MNNSLENILGLTSIALQLAGAILLLVRFWGNLRKDVLHEYFNSNINVNKDFGEEIMLHKDKIKKIIANIYLTRISFIYILMGYVLAVFQQTESKIIAILFILTTALILLAIAQLATLLIFKIKLKKDIKISYEEAVNDGDAQQIMSKEEAKQLWLDAKKAALEQAPGERQ